ncbi:hypothetical protein EDD16DRAFT_1702326 [Pisolithus croceorrhizus]|nr:hypothetical protein EDD16DRAFT_1702326 [Pisolithus croceorrhizus]
MSIHDIVPVTIHYSRHFPQITNRVLFMPERSPSPDLTNVTNHRVHETKAYDEAAQFTSPRLKTPLTRECTSSVSTIKPLGNRLGGAKAMKSSQLLVPRLPGQLSKPGAGGYSVREAFKWEWYLYRTVQNSPLLKQYQDAWPAADLATIFLKNTSSERWWKLGIDTLQPSP